MNYNGEKRLVYLFLGIDLASAISAHSNYTVMTTICIDADGYQFIVDMVRIKCNPAEHPKMIIDLKTDYDEVYGAFRSTLKSWVAPLNPEYLSKWIDSTVSAGQTYYSLNYGFFKVNPSVLDSIFRVKADSSMDTDQFLTSLYLDVKAEF